MAIFKRIVKFVAAYDKRNLDPSRNHGIHGVHIWFILKGKKGAVSFSIATNWMLPHVQAEIDAKPLDLRFPYLFHKPQPFGVDYHSPKPLHDFQKNRATTNNCEWLNGKPCYSDGSALYGDEVFKRLLMEGEEGLWNELEQFYNESFEKEVK